MRRGLIVGGAAVALVVAIGGAGAMLIGSHQSPPRLALGSPTPAGSASDLVGRWKVGSGSEAGYRVREQFINQPAPTEAVARTSHVAGGLNVVAAAGALRVTNVQVTVDLASLQSQDRYATYQVYQRDFFIRTIYLETNQYPAAEFKAGSVSLPSGPLSGTITLSVSGKLTVHGVSRDVTTKLQVQRSGAGLEVVGSIDVDMRDYGVEVPSIAFTKAEPGVVIEYHLLLVRG
ncbi:MAG TPA: YceI family protein [Candidatus Dormibacteraeota bacterium]|nr:YceI family protein [Candidatus Dormibacteraeota bacterium]